MGDGPEILCLLLLPPPPRNKSNNLYTVEKQRLKESSYERVTGLCSTEVFSELVPDNGKKVSATSFS
jgi:hypothetical protein